MKNIILSFFILLCLGCNSSHADNLLKHVINVKQAYGTIDSEALQLAINEAIQYRSNNPDTNVIIQLDEGKYKLDQQVNIARMNTDGTGWLIIRGEGSDVTELVDTEYEHDDTTTFRVIEPYRLRMEGFQITGERITTSQGTIVAVHQNDKQIQPVSTYLDIDIDQGYPDIDHMYDIETTKANKIRIFDDADVPHFNPSPDGNHYAHRWDFEGDDFNFGSLGIRPYQIKKNDHENIWRFKLRDEQLAQRRYFPFEVGQRVGISSKTNRTEWARFGEGGEDIVIENIRLLRMGRVKFRGEWTNIRFTNVKIMRPKVNGKYSFYSTDAGPQFGHDKGGDENIYNLIVEHNDLRGTIDDGSAFQRVKSGHAENNHWEDCGGVLVGENTSKDFSFFDNYHENCPFEDMR